jgi:hypothetical protein
MTEAFGRLASHLVLQRCASRFPTPTKGRQRPRLGLRVLWPVQDAPWGRFLVVEDPDGRPVALARMAPLPS